MKNNIKAILFLTLISLFFFMSREGRAGWVPQRHYTVDDGLPQSIITDIMKDSRGFIWLASNGGVSRFDGHIFHNYSVANGYPFHLVTGIIEKEPGVFWVADYASGLYELKDEQVRKLQLPFKTPDARINFLRKEKDNTILISLAPDGLIVCKNDSMQDYFDVPGYEDEPVISAALDQEGAVWVGTFNRGAFRMKDGRVLQTVTEEDGLPGSDVRSILPMANGRVWFGTNDGLFVLGDKSLSDDFNRKYPHSFVFGLTSQSAGDVWLTVSKGDGGLFHFKGGKIVQVVKRKSGFYPRTVNIDEDQVMYVSSNNGFYVIPDRSFTNFDYRDGLEDPYIKAVTREPSGKLWVATKGAGLYWMENGVFKHFDDPDYFYLDKTITCMRFHKDKLWLGTRRGLFYIKGGKALEDTLSRYIGDNEIRMIYTYKNGPPVVLTKKSIVRQDKGSITSLCYNLQGKNNSFWGLAYDKNQTLFLATNGNGLWTLQDTVWRAFEPAAAMDVKSFFGIRADEAGNLYFPSNRGAYKWDGRYFKRIFNALETVWDLLPGKKGEIWLGTNHGLFRKENNISRVYNRKSGFVSTEYNVGSFYKDKDKSLWFGGVTGLLHYKPGKEYKPLQGKLYITSIQCMDSVLAFPPAEGLVFGKDDNNLVFNYSYVNLLYSGNLEYRYFLEGFDRDTLYAGNESMIKYTNLPDGMFTLHIFVRKEYDEKDLARQTISFYIEKPWHKAWWAYLLYFSLAAVLLYLLIQWRLQALRKRNAELERSIRDRTTDLRFSNKRLIKEVQERKKAELEVAREKEQLAVTLRSITDGVIRTDENGIVLLMNEIAEQLTGFRDHEAVGKKAADICILLDEKSKKPIPLTPEKIVKDHQYSFKPFIAILQQKAGAGEILISLNGSPILDQDKKVQGYVFIFRDITHERELEEEFHKAQKLDSIGLLAGGIAHDFNNILSGIMGNAQLAELSHIKGKDVQKYLEGIVKATQKATNLTQQLLTFSKGGMPVKKKITLQPLLSETVRFALRGSNVNSRLSISEDLWPAYADAGQINQVINNLVINADQAMPGGGMIELRAKNIFLEHEQDIPGLKAGAYVQIEIIDQGIGISEENLNKIFDPYFTTKQKGSGLGLASSYSIVEKHGGTILVRSKVNQGSTFFVYLPAIREKIEQEEEVQEKKLIRGKGRILVMDDEEYIREIINDMLEFLGYEVRLAADGKEALRMYEQAKDKQAPFDLVIMDLTVPGGVGGLKAVKKLLQIDPRAKVVVASGYSTDSALADYEKYGFKGMLNKPFSIEELSALVPRLLEQ